MDRTKKDNQASTAELPDAFDFLAHLPEILQHVRASKGGGIYAFRSDAPRGAIVALTRQRVTGSVAEAFHDAFMFATHVAIINEAMTGRLIVGWRWDDNGELFVEVSLCLASLDDSIALARVFRQAEVYVVADDGVLVVSVSHSAGPDSSPSSAEGEA